MMFRLIMLSGPHKGQRMTVEPGGMSVGRDSTCSLVLEDEEVGGQHAVLEQDGDSLTLRDLNSSGKMLVNSEVVEKARVKHGDVIEIGQTRLFVEAIRPAGISGTPGLWLLNRILTIVALIAMPIAFLYTVALLEQTYLGIGDPARKPAPDAEAGTRPLQSPGDRLDALTLTQQGIAQEVAELDVAERPLPGASGTTAAAKLLTNREERGMVDMTIAGTPHVEDFKKPLSVVQVVRIASVEESKFQESDELDEMRVLDVRLAPESEGQRLTPESVQVDVSLFDKNVKTGDILQTHARVAVGPLNPEGAWKQDEQKTIRVTYAVPKGARTIELNSDGGEQYFGYRVRVYYHGQLQDERAQPKVLLDYSANSGSGLTGWDKW